MSDVTWDCVIHPVEWQHEYGCPHRTWSAEELLDGLLSLKLTGEPLYDDRYKENSTDGIKSPDVP